MSTPAAPGPYRVVFEDRVGLLYLMGEGHGSDIRGKAVAVLVGPMNQQLGNGRLLAQAPAMQDLLKLLVDDRDPLPPHLLRLEAAKILRAIGGNDEIPSATRPLGADSQAGTLRDG